MNPEYQSSIKYEGEVIRVYYRYLKTSFILGATVEFPGPRLVLAIIFVRDLQFSSLQSEL
jgi:hypothetical protein